MEFKTVEISDTKVRVTTDSPALGAGPCVVCKSGSTNWPLTDFVFDLVTGHVWCMPCEEVRKSKEVDK